MSGEWRKGKKARQSGQDDSGGVTPRNPRQYPQTTPDNVFHLFLPFSPKVLGADWISAFKSDASRFGCTMSWRASRRTPLGAADEAVPYTVTVTGDCAAQLLDDLQNEIYRNWPLPTPPPNTMNTGLDYTDNGDGELSCLYSFNMPGQQEPRTVRLYRSFADLAKSRWVKPGGIGARRIKSNVKSRWLDPADMPAEDLAPEDFDTVPAQDPAEK